MSTANPYLPGVMDDNDYGSGGDGGGDAGASRVAADEYGVVSSWYAMQAAERTGAEQQFWCAIPPDKYTPMS